MSILTNLKKDLNFIEDIYSYSNYTENEFSVEKKKIFDEFLNAVEEQLLKSDITKIKKVSAELNALMEFYKINSLKDLPKTDMYCFLHTDTYLGKNIAKILENVFKKNGIGNVFIETSSYLRTSDFEKFSFSLSELAKKLAETLKEYKSNGYKIIFNLTGGFKSINSFLQTVASLYADESIYIFETSNSLLRIPKLPVKVDDTIFIEHFDLFRMLDLGIYNERIKKEIYKLPEILYLEIDGDFIISAWGTLVWQEVKENTYKERLNNPISDKIRISDYLKKQFEDLNPFERLQLNKKIDDFEKAVATNFGYNPSSLRFHELEGKISKIYKYEFYPFDGDDSRRLYIREDEDGIYILDKIDKHLK
ncbi:putative CRISPR-associated protein [Caldicellulosiruptor morganii]|uniref:CRISPR-associated protein n=1 Tax=Caldicellulosiruptor morganii TaxID=1387555 RepID=A0ABY7BPT6_9FIRM|nr:putative CRISPR-associated protein [Caldicellulosiruptor morganii]WAM33917.1 putative CRISPR-associated protein [Caldicellulosiruptor morganii]